MVNAKEKGIKVVLVGFKDAYRLDNDIETNNKVYIDKNLLSEEKISQLFNN